MRTIKKVGVAEGQINLSCVLYIYRSQGSERYQPSTERTNECRGLTSDRSGLYSLVAEKTYASPDLLSLYSVLLGHGGSAGDLVE